MNNDHETVLAALFAALVASVVVNFTATASISSPTLTAVSSTKGLFNGLPVFGPGIPSNTYVSSFDPVGLTVTLTNTPTQAGSGVSFSTGFMTTGRRAKFWSDVTEQPALYLRHIAAEFHWDHQAASKAEIEADIWIYSRAGSDPDVAPDTTLNNLVECVLAAMAPDNPATKTFTIGGACYWCRVDGRAEYDTGDIDDQAIARIPIKILLP